MIGLAVLLLATAQAAPDRNCADHNGVDRCAEARQSRMRELFGMRTIEAHRDAGDQVRRVFYVAFGHERVAIAFVRSPGREPIVSVHFPRRDGRPAPEPIQAVVPYEVWTEVLARSAHFDRSLVPLPSRPGERSTCSPRWVYTVEATDPARANLRQPAALRRTTENSCADGLAEAFAMDAQRLALPLFPHCGRIDLGQDGNPAAQLGACWLLSGDRMAAVEVLNRLRALLQAGQSQVVDDLGIFKRDARIEWHGRPSPDRGAASAFWLSGLAEAPRATFFYEVVEGLAADRVRVTGALWRYTGGENSVPTTHYAAPVEQIWVIGRERQFEIVSATIGPWEVRQPY